MKRITRKTTAIILAVLCVCALFFTGCKEDGPVTLRIVTESINTSTDDWANERLDQQLSKTIIAYKESHENVDFVIERIPQKGSERTNVLERLRTELMSGKGPDILLLPGNCLVRGERNALQESLILDVNQAMRNGLFADISEYYDADTELGKESLNTTVMDAGVVDGARYVLPLRYDFPVVCVSVERFAKTGLSKDTFNTNILSFMQAAVQTDDRTAISMLTEDNVLMLENLMPQAVDYDEQQVRITNEELVQYCQTYWAYQKKCFRNSLTSKERNPHTTDLYTYINEEGTDEYLSWLYSDHWMCIESLDRAIHVAALAEFAGVEIEMYPVRATDGSLVADVTYYGAISAGCENVGVAYDFLRQLLLEDFQWEKSTDAKTAFNKLSASGWPVRVKDSANPLAQGLMGQLSFSRESFPLKEALYTMADGKIPVLEAEIDRACFPISWYDEVESEIYRTFLLDYMDNGTADAEALAEHLLKTLEWHLAES